MTWNRYTNSHLDAMYCRQAEAADLIPGRLSVLVALVYLDKCHHPPDLVWVSKQDYSLVEDINASQDTPIIFAWRSGPGIIQHPNSQRGPAWENVVSGPIAVARDEPENDFTLLSMLLLLVWMAITHYSRARALEANGKNLSLFHRVRPIDELNNRVIPVLYKDYV